MLSGGGCKVVQSSDTVTVRVVQSSVIAAVVWTKPPSIVARPRALPSRYRVSRRRRGHDLKDLFINCARLQWALRQRGHTNQCCTSTLVAPSLNPTTTSFHIHPPIPPLFSPPPHFAQRETTGQGVPNNASFVIASRASCLGSLPQ